MSNKKGISIKDYFNAPSSITQPTAEPSNESDGNTSTSLPNETTNDKQQPPLSENQRYHPDSSYVFPETVFGKQTRLVQSISMARLQHFRRFWLVTCASVNVINIIWKQSDAKKIPFWKKVLKIGRRHSKNSKNINQASVTEQHLPTKYSFLDVLMLLNCLITKKRKCENSTVGVSWLSWISYSILLVKGYRYEVMAVMKIRTFSSCWWWNQGNFLNWKRGSRKSKTSL